MEGGAADGAATASCLPASPSGSSWPMEGGAADGAAASCLPASPSGSSWPMEGDAANGAAAPSWPPPISLSDDSGPADAGGGDAAAAAPSSPTCLSARSVRAHDGPHRLLCQAIMNRSRVLAARAPGVTQLPQALKWVRLPDVR